MSQCKNCGKVFLYDNDKLFFCSKECFLEYETGNKQGKLYIKL